MDFLSGEVLYFDKPLGWTSFDLVAKVRRALCRALGEKKLKVGHTGTLDPLATGLVTICTGRATKQIDTLQYLTKEYEATLQLGATTPSFDMEHPVDAEYPTSHITEGLVREVLPTFLGAQWQVPPVYSAVSVGGKRAYEFARQGQSVALKPKLLQIDSIDLLSFDAERMQLSIRVVCSKGTYIRALARDIGERLGSGAYLRSLRRTRVGDVRVEDAWQLDAFLASIESVES